MLDSATPHKVSLLALIKIYIIERSGCNTSKPLSSLDLQKDLAHLIIREIQGANSHIEMNLYTLLQTLCSFTDTAGGATVACSLLNILKSIDSPDALSDFFAEDVTKLLYPNDVGDPQLAKDSLFGIFVRKMILMFDRMMFSRLGGLYSALLSYLAAETKATATGPSKDDRTLPLSKSAAEQFLAQQIMLLEEGNDSALPSQELRLRIAEIIRHLPGINESHYANYLNYLRMGEQVQSLESLHRYFDGMHGTAAYQGADRGTGMSMVEQMPVTGLEVTGGGRFHYATLCLTHMHYRFSNMEEALKSNIETIRLAQEAGDSECLHHALGWMVRLKSSRSLSLSLLKQYVVRARELGLPHLLAPAVLFQARAGAAAGAMPRSILRSLNECSRLCARYNMGDVTAQSCVLRASLWSSYGDTALSSLASQAHLHFFADIHGRTDAAVEAVCQLAFQWHLGGDFDGAVRVINQLRGRFPVGSSESLTWMMCLGEMLHQRALDSEDWFAAETIGVHLSAFSSGRSPVDMTAEFRYAQLLTARGNYARAADVVHQLVRESEREELNVMKAQHLPKMATCTYHLALADIHVQAGSPASALDHARSCIAFCELHHFFGLRSVAILTLAEALLGIGDTFEAIKLIESVLPYILARSPLRVQSTAHLLMAICAMATPDRSGSDINIIESINMARYGFSRLDWITKVRQTYYIEARFYHECGDFHARNAAARSAISLNRSASFSNIHSGLETICLQSPRQHSDDSASLC